MEIIGKGESKSGNSPANCRPVSYTHLDVYKRQEQLTIKEPIIMVKKKILASFPVIPILKLEIMYQRTTIAIATYTELPSGIGTK